MNGSMPTPRGVPVNVTGPVSSFGELLVADVMPRVQVDAIYGALSTDVQTYTSGTGAAATASGGLFVCTSGTDVGGYGTIRTERVIRYRPGQGILARFTAMFDAGVANYLSGAGLFTAVDGYWVGYLGTSFGFMRRIAGAAEIRTLTITGGATGAGTIAITLDGVSTNVAIGGVLSAAATAQTIAATSFGSGWYAYATGAVVTFFATAVGAKAGAFSFSAGATGATATGPTQAQAGAANDQSTGFVAQSAWNIDKCDGTGPSGVSIDPTKLNIYQISVPYLGAGGAVLSVVDPISGQWVDCHRIRYPNSAVVPHSVNPTYRLGWLSASLGSATSLTVKGASAMGATTGRIMEFRNPFAVGRTATSVSTEVAILSLRSNWAFNNTANLREIVAHTLSVGVEGTKPAVIKVYLGGTLSGTPAWTSVSSGLSSADWESSNGLTLSGGILVASAACAGSGTLEMELHELDLRLSNGDTLTITGTITGGAGSNIAVGLNWQEY